MPGWLRGVLIAALAGWAVFQSSHMTVVAAGSDASGYLNSAKLFAQGELTLPQRIPAELGADYEPIHFLPLGFWMAPEAGRIAPTYPPGLPLHFAIGGLLFGWDYGPAIVLVVTTLACFMLLYGLGRELGLSPWLAAAGPAVLALSPVFVFAGLQPLSDLPATTWCCAAAYTALRARRGGLRWAAGTGACLAVAVLVRPSNVLLLPCLLLLLGDWRRIVAAGLAGLPGALWQAYLNQSIYGHALKTGYGDIVSVFSREWFVPTLEMYARWLPVLLPAVLLLLPFAALIHWRQQAVTLLALFVWWLAYLIFYAFYAVTHEVWWCLRFVLPAFPALLLMAMLGLEALLKHRASAARRWRAGLAVSLIGWAALLFHHWNARFGLLHLGRYELAYKEAADWARDRLPPDAVVATMPASGALYHYTDFPVLRWDVTPTEACQKYASRLRHGGRPLFAMLFPGEEQAALRERMPGKWKQIGEVSGITFWKDVTSLP